jgi:uncharacterized membrane protein YadS
VFNIAVVLIFPAVGRLLGMSDSGFGVWAGTAVNDTSSVVAAGLAFSQAALDTATVVKLTRTLLIVPIVLVLVARTAKELARAARADAAVRAVASVRSTFPWFVLWFIAAAGWRPLALGLSCWAAVALNSLAAQAALGRW